MLCIQQDVTAAYLKEQEQIAALEKAKLEADKANEAKSVFLSGMSHDLRTPLNGVLGFTSLALKENDPARKQELLQKVDTSGRLLRDLINDTLDLSRIESGKARVEAEAVMPDDLIPAVTVALKASAELKNIRYNTDFDIDTASPVWCDKLKVQKIALNLISNAIRYTPKGGTVSIALRSEKRNETASCYILTVSDTGIGMSEQFLERMYEPFAQEKRSELIMEPGTGLGLSIVKSYVDLMGGTIRVASKVHEGTCIEVTIPYSTEDRQPDQARENDAAAGTLAGKRILLCEDNQMNTEIAVMLLKEQGMLVETAENGNQQTAWKYFRLLRKAVLTPFLWICACR
jgi:signal transduction histidine kinase